MSLTTMGSPTRPGSPARPRALSVARVVIGGAALLKAGIMLPILLDLAEPGAIRLPMATWLPSLPVEAMMPVFGLWVASGLLFVVGWRTVVSGTLLAVALLAVLAGDQQLYSNHLYLLLTVVALMTLAWGGAGWAVPLLLLQVSIVYGFAALAKLNPAYLSGAVLQFFIGRGSILTLPEILRSFDVMVALAWLSVLAESLLATCVWFRGLRPAILLTGVLFHVAIVLFLGPPLDLVVFALVMFSLYVLHLDRENLVPVRVASNG